MIRYPRREIKAIVFDVADGDTISVVCALGLGIWREERVRLKFCDADELVGDRRAYALKSRDETNRDILGATVTLVVTSEARDQYGRLIAECVLAGATLSSRQVAAGRAIARGAEK